MNHDHTGHWCMKRSTRYIYSYSSNFSPLEAFKRLTKEGLVELSEGLLSFGSLLCFFTEPVTQPFVRITDTTVNAHRSVTFTCITPDVGIPTLWLFNNHNLQVTERIKMSPTKCGLRIDNVRSEDAGEYQCMVTNRAGDTKASHPVRWP